MKLLDSLHVDIHIPDDMSAKDVARVRKFTRTLDDRIKRMIRMCQLTQKLTDLKIEVEITK